MAENKFGRHKNVKNTSQGNRGAGLADWDIEAEIKRPSDDSILKEPHADIAPELSSGPRGERIRTPDDLPESAAVRGGILHATLDEERKSGRKSLDLSEDQEKRVDEREE